MTAEQEFSKPIRSTAATSISQDFREHVRFLYQEAFKVNVRRREGRNWATKFAIPAYISAAAAIEAFINESLLSHFAQGATSQSDIWQMTEEERDKLERMPTGKKVLELTRRASGKSLDPNKQPYLDMMMLFTLRNSLMHYKFKPEVDEISTVVNALSDRKIAFAASVVPPVALVDRVSTTEGIRWAYNLIVDFSLAQIEVMPDHHFKGLMMQGVQRIGENDWAKLIPKSEVAR